MATVSETVPNNVMAKAIKEGIFAGVIAFLIWTLGSGAQTSQLRPGSVVALAGGFLAGAVYWLIAGRTSGSWRSGSGAGGRQATD